MTLAEVDDICRGAGLTADPDRITWRGPGDNPYVAALVERDQLIVVEVEADGESVEIDPSGLGELRRLLSPGSGGAS